MGCDKGTDDEGCKGEHGEDLPTSDAQDSVCDTSKQFDMERFIKELYKNASIFMEIIKIH